ncbi:MAG: 5-(carboxyamino)imidazole ribonucleotide mutase [Candidatus Omnitrophota bacterium]
MKMPAVSVIMGSDSDMSVMKNAHDMLNKFGIACEVKILSAHRSPEDVARFARHASRRGIKVIIAGAGGAAHLAGVVASLTSLPVIGVPMESQALRGIDSLLSTVQMPAGVPVATMAIGPAGARNAGIFAAEIIALSDRKLAKKLEIHKKDLAVSVRKKNRKINP